MVTPITDTTGDEHGESQRRHVEMRSRAIDLWNLNWPVLPLGGANGKELLATGITGYSPNDAGLEDIRYWSNRFGPRWRNNGVRCPIGVLGIDVDDYEKAGKTKRGLATIAEYETKFGELLPDTYITTARPGGSGIRWFKIPDDWTGPGALKSLTDLPPDTEAGVELIQRHHRYAVAPGSIHLETGQRYRLYGPDGAEIVDGLMPPPESLPELPESWRDGLAAIITTRAVSGRDFNRDEIAAWLDAYTGNDYPHGLPQVVKTFEKKIDAGTGWDAAMVSALPWALKESAAGGYPAHEAKRALREHPTTVAAIAKKSSRADRFENILASAIGYAEADDHGARWLRMNRNYGTDTRDYAGHAERVHFHTESGDPTTNDDDTPSWSPVDMSAALAGGEEIATTILARTDGVNLFYRHKVHSVHGESESGKTWLALCAVAECLTGGEPVLYIDFEDDAKGVGARLLLMGVPRAVVTDPALFSYVRPETGLGADDERKAFEYLLSESYSLAVLDGVTESMGLLGLIGKDNDNVASWQRTLPNAIARRTGAAVVCIDHVTKDADTRGRFAIGGQQKMAGLSGAAFIIEPETPFARGLAGVASVRVGKDRPGFLRAMGGDWRKADRTQLVAMFILDSTDPARVQWMLEPPDDSAHGGQSGHGTEEPRRKWCMEQVSRYWETQNPNGDENPKARGLAACSTTKTENAMVAEHKGSGIARDLWRAAIGALVVEGYAKQIDGSRNSKLHRVVRPYRELGDESPDSPQVAFRTVSEAKFRGAHESEFNERSDDEAV